MVTRRRFLGCSSMAPALLAYGPQLAAADAGPEISATARAVHSRALVFDGHVHALDREFYQGGSFGDRKPDGYWDLPRAREGGLGAFFLSVYIPEPYLPGRFETKQALRRIEHALEQVQLNRAQVELALNGDDVERIRAKGKIAAVLDIEGSYDLDGDLDVLRGLHRLGLRSAMLSAHNWSQHYADACCSPAQVSGLTAHGREVVREMNRLGMVINVSHGSDESTSAAIDASADPIVATHGGLRSVVDIPRNTPDWLLKKLAARGGVFGMEIGNEFHSPVEYAYQTKHAEKSFWDTSAIPKQVEGLDVYQVDKLVAPQFPRVGMAVPDSVRVTADQWVAVLDRLIQVVGEDHVSIGTDFDGGPNLPRGMRDTRDLPILTDAMLRRGYSEAKIRKFWGGNLLRVFRQVTQKHA
jgi:membrane dipeptidase